MDFDREQERINHPENFEKESVCVCMSDSCDSCMDESCDCVNHESEALD